MRPLHPLALLKRPYAILTLILLWGFGLRIYRLVDNPPGFFADEASIGYNTYTILTRGTDEYNVPYPLFSVHLIPTAVPFLSMPRSCRSRCLAFPIGASGFLRSSWGRSVSACSIW